MASINAGGIPDHDDPLHSFPRALSMVILEIGGRPIVQRVLDALDRSPRLELMVIVGLPEKCRLQANRPVEYVFDRGILLANARARWNWIRAQHNLERPRTDTEFRVGPG
jgi:hypothetical protein